MSEFREGSPTSDILSDGMDSLSMRDKALLKRSVSKHHNNNFKAGYVPVHEQYLHKTGLRGRKTFAFWTLVFLLFILAVGNLILTIIILGVLRLGQGMQTLELIPEESAIKFFGNTDLGHIYKRDGKLEGFKDAPVEILGDSGSVLFNLTSRNGRPVSKLKMNKNGTTIRSSDRFEIKNKHGSILLSTDTPHYNVLKRLNSIKTKIIQTNRVVSPVNENLDIEHKTVNLKGSEGTRMEGREILWTADQDIYLKSMNGSLVLSGKEGILIDIKKIPIAIPKHSGYISAQYKVCVCMPQGKLFRVPVPSNPNARVYCNQVNMAPQHNPCI